MHAHERTMLARLGFADPDKKDRRHDLACQYLAQRPVVDKIVPLLGLEQSPQAYERTHDNAQEKGITAKVFSSYETELEYQVSKGSDEYRTTIGFVDLVYYFTLEIRYTQRSERKFQDYFQSWSSWKNLPDSNYREHVNIGVEVKISPTTVGDIIRQISLYRSYIDHWYMHGGDSSRWILATAYPLSSLDIQSLAKQQISHVLLGKGFEKFVDFQEQLSVAKNIEV